MPAGQTPRLLVLLAAAASAAGDRRGRGARGSRMCVCDTALVVERVRGAVEGESMLATLRPDCGEARGREKG